MSKVVPRMGDDGNTQIGTIPLRTSSNQVLGVVHCPNDGCEGHATVHNPRGRRSGKYYTICDNCGQDQRKGDAHQDWLRATMKQTIEQLPGKGNQLVAPAAECDKPAQDTVTVKEPVTPIAEPQLVQTKTPALERQPEPENEPDFDPATVVPGTNPPPPETAPPKAPDDEQAPDKSGKVIKFGLVGLVLGALLGLA